VAQGLKVRSWRQPYRHWKTGEPKERRKFFITIPRQLAAEIPEDARFEAELTLEGGILFRPVSTCFDRRDGDVLRDVEVSTSKEIDGQD
jgi:hypothetical protein